MTEIKQQIDRLLRYSRGNGAQYENRIFLLPEHRAMAATNGHVCLLQRAHYDVISVMARLKDARALVWLDVPGILEKTDDFLDIARLVPKVINGRYMSLYLPEWLKNIPEDTDKPVIGICTVKPSIVLELGRTDCVYLNAHYLKDVAGQMLAAHFNGPRDKVVLMPKGQRIERAEWVALINPVNSINQTIPKWEKG